MNWLRNVLGLGEPSAPPRPTASLGLEMLEVREVPNATVAFDAAGNKNLLIVYQDGSLWRYGPDAATSGKLADGVRSAHIFRDASGGIGYDIVYTNGNAFEFDSTGGRTLGTGNVLSASRAYDDNGNTKLLILFANATTGSPPFGVDERGNLFEFTNTGGSLLQTNVRWASTYIDSAGGLGTAIGVIAANGDLFAFRFDTVGSAQLYRAPNGATQDITDFSQDVNPLTGELDAIVTSGRFAGTYSLEFNSLGVSLIGSGTNILVGG